MYYSIAYSLIQFFGAAFKEGQSLIYLKVAQAAFIQLSEVVFVHLHQLSLDWHLQKKLGEVMRSMDRGIAACDTLMKYLFLWLVPALAECLVVCIIFATYFHYAPLAICVFYFVWLYIVWTILLTLWRKKFRKAVVKSDNEWHDRATDSLINFETVKVGFSQKENSLESTKITPTDNILLLLDSISQEKNTNESVLVNRFLDTKLVAWPFKPV